MREVRLGLATPPEVVNAGVGVHGTASLDDVFLLPDLWQLHLYGYSATLTVGGVVHDIRPGSVSLIPPGAEVRFDYRGRSEHLYAHLRLPSDGPLRTVPLMQRTGAQRQTLTDRMLQAVSAPKPQAAAEIWSVLWRVAQLPRPAANPGHSAVAKALAYIEKNLFQPLTVPGIARAAGISHNHLTRLVRAETGSTVVAYIRRRRLSHAAHLLRHSTLSIPAIAAAVGIPDLQAFNKACRRELGVSPRAFRA
ncbi:helix-turn-helix domain-containing protein [Allorhizocola rhizosphaerae]|uniref:helix-turn-helix domain-containing protein n=1 Tax=Allorhizocola rhizosphaerae TaxID=1872709 RepID=UPI000E3CC049|nr:AraC family transcriptional regulator [Allorhizocola rhizosphaerae]